MTSFVVADVGNSRVKWGRCDEHAVLDSVSLPLGDASAYERQFVAWDLPTRTAWTIAGVNPGGVQSLSAWLETRRAPVPQIVNSAMIPLQSSVDQREQVGVDRLLNAVALNSRRESERSGIVVDAGSAVTVDWIDVDGVFRGGAIFPGLRLMAQALHQFTAKLPLVHWQAVPLLPPGRNTEQAILAGIHAAVGGGIERLGAQLCSLSTAKPHLWLTGGDAGMLARSLQPGWNLWPNMTLEGLRLTALRHS
jgi:type III pantothenate kinase